MKLDMSISLILFLLLLLCFPYIAFFGRSSGWVFGSSIQPIILGILPSLLCEPLPHRPRRSQAGVYEHPLHVRRQQSMSLRGSPRHSGLSPLEGKYPSFVSNWTTRTPRVCPSSARWSTTENSIDHCRNAQMRRRPSTSINRSTSAST